MLILIKVLNNSKVDTLQKNQIMHIIVFGRSIIGNHVLDDSRDNFRNSVVENANFFMMHCTNFGDKRKRGINTIRLRLNKEANMSQGR